MTDFLKRIDQTPIQERWRLVRPWIFSDPLPFFAELRAFRPVLELPEVTLVTRYSDCSKVLLEHDHFSVEPYVAKQGNYFMAQDDTAQHWREKSIMKSVLDFEDLPKIREYVRDQSKEILQHANGSLEAVGELTRKLPTLVVQEWFGFASSQLSDLVEWSYWNQMDAFWNQPFDSIFVADAGQIVANREAANEKMELYLTTLVQRRISEIQNGNEGDDVVSRLIRLHFSNALDFSLERLVLNIGGLLIGTVETISHSSVNALLQLYVDPQRWNSARAAAADPDPFKLSGYIFEALRFQPAFPYFFRRCERPIAVAVDTDFQTMIEPGTMVLAVTHSAMFDERVFLNPDRFDPDRSLRSMFHFGLGLHECLGRAIAAVVISEIVRQALLLENLQFSAVDRRNGPVPERWEWRW